MKIDIINTYNSYTYFANPQNPNLMSTPEQKALLTALPGFIVSFYDEQPDDDTRKHLLALFEGCQNTTLENAIEKLKKSGIESIVVRIKYDGMIKVLDEFITRAGKAGVGGKTWGPILLGSLVDILATHKVFLGAWVKDNFG